MSYQTRSWTEWFISRSKHVPFPFTWDDLHLKQRCDAIRHVMPEIHSWYIEAAEILVTLIHLRYDVIMSTVTAWFFGTVGWFSVCWKCHNASWHQLTMFNSIFSKSLHVSPIKWGTRLPSDHFSDGFFQEAEKSHWSHWTQLRGASGDSGLTLPGEIVTLASTFRTPPKKKVIHHGLRRV